MNRNATVACILHTDSANHATEFVKKSNVIAALGGDDLAMFGGAGAE